MIWLYRYHVIMDDECKQLLDAIPLKERSKQVREWMKKGAQIPKEPVKRVKISV